MLLVTKSSRGPEGDRDPVLYSREYCSVSYGNSNILYHIVANFRAAKFSRIGIFKIFAETIFADHGLKFCGSRIKILRSLIFEVRCQSAKNAKMMRLETLALYGTGQKKLDIPLC